MRYPDSSSQSFALNQRARQSLPGGNTRTTVYMKPYPIYAARGLGCRVWDVDGTERIDCINNFTAAIHGYAHPAILRAAEDEMRNLKDEYVSTEHLMLALSAHPGKAGDALRSSGATHDELRAFQHNDNSLGPERREAILFNINEAMHRFNCMIPKGRA